MTATATANSFYCTRCGAIQPLGQGLITCRSCGNPGLRGFNRRPHRVSCPHPDCDFRGWDDGGVNDDLGPHLRRDHTAEDNARVLPAMWATIQGARKPHRFAAGENTTACGKWARGDIYGRVEDPGGDGCRPCARAS